MKILPYLRCMFLVVMHFDNSITFILVRYIIANWDNSVVFPFNLRAPEKIVEVIKRSIPFNSS